MARGRDAVDVALTTSFGTTTLVKFVVWTDEVGPEAMDQPPAIKPVLTGPRAAAATGPSIRGAGGAAGPRSGCLLLLALLLVEPGMVAPLVGVGGPPLALGHPAHAAGTATSRRGHRPWLGDHSFHSIGMRSMGSTLTATAMDSSARPFQRPRLGGTSE